MRGRGEECGGWFTKWRKKPGDKKTEMWAGEAPSPVLEVLASGSSTSCGVGSMGAGGNQHKALALPSVPAQGAELSPSLRRCLPSRLLTGQESHQEPSTSLTVLQAGSASAGQSVFGVRLGPIPLKSFPRSSNLQWPKQTSLHCNTGHE